MASIPLEKVRNIGISAHIDSGKTTLTERILFYTGRIHAIHEVRGKDGVGAKMDSMDLEREKGITIQSAATYCEWKRATTSTSSTPPGTSTSPSRSSARSACSTAPSWCSCAVAGVQSQSITVDRQMRRYNVPRLAFINKWTAPAPTRRASRTSSRRSCATTRHASSCRSAPRTSFEGVIDLIKMKAFYFDGDNGEDIREEEIPADTARGGQDARARRCSTSLADVDDELTEQVPRRAGPESSRSCTPPSAGRPSR